MIGRIVAIILVCIYIYAIWKKKSNPGPSNSNKLPKPLKLITDPQYEDFCRCSGPFPKSRVVNGTSVVGFDFEWVVAIYSPSSKTAECTGTLLSEKTVLTTASCIHKKKIGGFQVLAGFLNDYTQAVDTPWGSRKIRSVRFHHNYRKNINTKPNPYDVAILYLTKPFELGFNNSIFLSCILSHDLLDPQPYDYYSAGYGEVKKYYNVSDKYTSTYTQQTTTNSLNSLKLNYDKETCNDKKITDSFFCLKSSTSSFCNKDEGSGIYIFIGNKMILVGVYGSSKSQPINETTSLNCAESSTSYNIKLSSVSDLTYWAFPRCRISNKYF